VRYLEKFADEAYRSITNASNPDDTMIRPYFQRSAVGTVLLGLCLAATMCLNAQQRGGGGGGGQSRSSGGGGGGGSTSQRTYPNNSSIGDAVISVDPDTKRIIVIGDEPTTDWIQQVITNLDKPRPQVLIKVVFLELTYNKSTDIGVEGGYTKKLNSTTTGTFSNLFGLTPGLAGTPATIATPPGAGLYQVLGQDYQVTLRAIASAGKAEVLSRPSILARNNQPATITVGQSVPLITSVRYDTLGNAINALQYTDVGIILRVTPFITSDGLVEMIVSPELSSVSATDKVPISNGVSAPVIDKRSADTVVVTPDGQTVVIGGLMQHQKTMSENKVPLLGDIPLLGNLFKSKSRGDVRTELIIFLTPHIVAAPSQLAALTDKESKQLTPSSFSEQELNKFLDRLPNKDAKKKGGTQLPSVTPPTVPPPTPPQ